MSQMERLNQGKQIMGYSIRTERYRYSMWNRGAEGEELYDYASDPRELKNLSGEAGASGVKAGLQTELERMIENRRK